MPRRLFRISTYGVLLLRLFANPLIRRLVPQWIDRLDAGCLKQERLAREVSMPDDRMPFWFPKSEVAIARIHYQGLVYSTLAALWARRLLVASILIVSLVAASVVLVLLGPRYTGEATIQLTFVRDEPATAARTLPTASLDATAVVDGAARIIRSRATASAVVTRLGLDKDPAFARESLSWRVFSSLRSFLGFEQVALSNHDLAEEQVMRRISVTNDPRSYLISVAVTARDPEWAARLANAVAFEYLRQQSVQQATEQYAAAAREMAEISLIYGAHHPLYLTGKRKLEDLDRRLSAMRAEAFDEDTVTHVTGQSFVAAQKVMVPSGPNIVLVLGLTAVGALGVGAWLALQPWSDMRPVSDRVAIMSERTLESVRQLAPWISGGRRLSDHNFAPTDQARCDRPQTAAARQPGLPG